MTLSDVSIAINLPDSDGIIEHYAFLLTPDELRAILSLKEKQECSLPSLDGLAFRDEYGDLNIRYKNPGGYRTALTTWVEAEDIILKALLEVEE